MSSWDDCEHKWEEYRRGAMKCKTCGKEIGDYQPYFRVNDGSDDEVLCADCKEKEREAENANP